MKTARNNQNPITIREGYGIKGMTIELNINQMQALGSAYNCLALRKEFSEDLSVVEESLIPFLEIFKDYSLTDDNMWSNFKENSLPLENNMQA